MAMGAMAAIAVTSMLVEGYGQAQKGLNEARRLRAQNKAKIKQMQDQFALNTQNLHNNNETIKQNRLKNDFTIEESKLSAQDAFAQAFIGAGVKGRTMDVMAATLQGDVDRAHNQAKGIATQETDRQFLGLMRSSKQITAHLDNLESFDTDAMNANINMAMVRSGLNSAQSMVAASGAGGE